MTQNLDKFVTKMHLLSLSVIHENAPYPSNAFYAYDKEGSNLIVAGESKTTHIKVLKENNRVAVTIALDTKIVGKVQGVQILGTMREANDSEKKIYFKRYPYALAMKPEIWTIEINYAKFTDNTLGFGNKEIWERE
ncbi:MAG: hypothetical protein GX282_00775 [Campylobacteraceae bacterium]|nr:hypothetical protein [Campylobacteraceae bacterium]